jgi:hypothetical protein
MKVIGLQRNAAPHQEIEGMFSPATRLQFFARSEIVMNCCP